MNCYMTVCRESGVEDTDDLYPGKKPRQEQNFETHSPSGPVYLTYPNEVKGDTKEFDKAMTGLSSHFKVNTKYGHTLQNVNEVRLDS